MKRDIKKQSEYPSNETLAAGRYCGKRRMLKDKCLPCLQWIPGMFILKNYLLNLEQLFGERDSLAGAYFLE
jgi:hypothetical protein